MDEIAIMKRARKQQKRGLSIREFPYWDLEEMVKRNMLDKSFPNKGRGAGWPCYKISRRGRVALAKSLAK